MKKSTLVIVGIGLTALSVGYLASRKKLSALDVEITEKILDYTLVQNTNNLKEPFGIILKFDNGTELETYLNEDFKIFEGDFNGISYTVNKRNGIIDDESVRLFLKKSEIPKFLKEYVTVFSTVDGYKGTPEIIGLDSPLHPENSDNQYNIFDDADVFEDDTFEDLSKSIKISDVFIPNKVKETYKSMQNLKEVSKDLKTISKSVTNILSKLNK